ncbi:MAG: L-threonylcarbamoyladenylate synthase [Lachnospirales bacterium]
MDTKVLDFSIDNIKECAKIIKNNGLVAFPTETVYGLGGNALCPKAVEKIYSAKGRPSNNPLIAHVSSIDMVKDIVLEITPFGRILMEEFWAGPLTLVFKNKNMPSITRGDLDTIAVRMPKNEIALRLIEESGVPLAAPSANISGKPSPTSWEHVYKDLNGKIDCIIKGESCNIGIESTILDVTGNRPILLRPGKITKSDIEEKIGEIDIDASLLGKTKLCKPRAPGMMYKHYSPKGKVWIFYKSDIEAIKSKIETTNSEVAVICRDYIKFEFSCKVFSLGKTLEDVSKNIYGALRRCDDENIEEIYCEGFEELELGFSIMNRLNKAAEHK